MYHNMTLSIWLNFTILVSIRLTFLEKEIYIDIKTSSKSCM
jgi:hypothetical protein